MNKRISFLIESELDRAEVILAAKSLTDTLQDIAEKVAQMEPKDVMPLSDPMTTHFSAEQARAFSAAATEQLRGLSQKIVEVRDAIQAEIGKLEGTVNGEPMNDITAAADAPADDFDAALGGLEEPEAPADDIAAAADAETPEADMAASMGDGEADDMEDTAHAAGRARKSEPGAAFESAEPKKKIIESADAVVARQFGKLLREGASSRTAARRVMETYGLDLADLITIIEEQKLSR